MRWLILHALPAAAATLQALPPVKWTNSDAQTSDFNVNSAGNKIYIDASFSDIKDKNGLTLIPPSAYEFADTFREDISQLSGKKWTLMKVDKFPESGILLGKFRANASQLTYENGVETEEGYELEITPQKVYIGGTGSRGLFWGTRTLLQQLILANWTDLAIGKTIDAPAYATRGYMLDAGRKWYDAKFLKELCTYASFFKMSEFHYHSSDNYPLNRGHNETWQDVFSHFSLMPEKPELRGIVQRKNETLSRAEFEDFQKHCAQRGVTVIPEIEAPGHCLSITKWKPELALPKKDLLNLTHPDAVPTVKALWAEFLPWFQTKEVHIGADEYNATLANDYIRFVNEMSDFINSTSGKSIRIWGTEEPSKDLAISKNVIIQHWQYGQSDPVQLQRDGYQQINSEDWWAYVSLKNDHTPITPAPYPQFYNNTRTLNFADKSRWQWEPSLFNPVNTTEQLTPGVSGNRGATLAAWNDNGPDATTQLEAYYAMRDGIPVVAARAWAGARGEKIDVSNIDSTLALLTSKAPGQNLDRRLPVQTVESTPLFSWTRPSTSSPSTKISLEKDSYGPPYTLTLHASSPFSLTGPDTTLSLTPSMNSTGHALIFTTNDNFPYPLRSTAQSDGHDPGHPGRIWTNLTSSSHIPITDIKLPATIKLETDVVNGSRIWVDGVWKGRFEVFVFGGKNTVFSWSQMAFVAPLNNTEGGLDSVVLEAGLGGSRAGGVNGTSATSAATSGRMTAIRLSGVTLDVIVMLAMFTLLGLFPNL